MCELLSLGIARADELKLKSVTDFVVWLINLIDLLIY